MSDFIVIGGGIIGLLTARELVARGAAVTLLEAGGVGVEASWAGGGIISPLYPWRYSDFISGLVKRSQVLYPEIAAQLFAQTGIDVELQRSGLLFLDPKEKIPALTWARAQQMSLVVLDEAAVGVQQVGLGVAADALWMPDVMQVRNPRLLKALVSSLRKTSARLFEQQRVVKINHDAQHVSSVQTKDRTFSADKIIITAGAWSSELLPALNISVHIEPVKGQMLAFAAIPGLLNQMVLYHNHYLIPRQDGLIIAGSTLEHQAGFNKIPTKDARDELYHAALQILPALKDYAVCAQWAGLRPLYAQGEPFIGQLLPYDNLYLHAGHFRNGLVLAPGAVEYFLK